MKAVVIERPNEMKIHDIPVPEMKEDEVLIKVEASGICGTDVQIFRGDYIGEYPVIPGHEFSGTIEAIGAKVTRFNVGDRVAVEPNIACDNCYYCLNNLHNFCSNWAGVGVTRQGGMAEYVAVPEKAVFNIGKLSFVEASFVEPLSCVLHGIEKTNLFPGASVAILGAGPIGLLLLQCSMIKGATEITIVEKNPDRAEQAKEFGVDTVLYSMDGLKKDYYDLVIDATGVLSVMGKLIDYVAPGRNILFFGVPPTKQNVEIEAFPIFQKGITISSSYTSLRNSYQAVNLLASKKVRVNSIVSHQLRLEEFEEGIIKIEKSLDRVGKVVIKPSLKD